MVEEYWKDIPGWEERYQVSSKGRVRAKERFAPLPSNGKLYRVPPVILKQAIGGRAKNYKRVMLQHPKRRHAYVHHLVLEAFVGPRPPGLMVLHKDDNGFNNTLDNLRYGDRDENELDRHVARVAPGLEAAPF